MAANPFHFNKPTRPKDFLGREHVVEEILENLYDLDGDSYGIAGGRRFGKTSLLKALEGRLRQDLHQPEDLELLVVPVYVSLKTIEINHPWDVFGLFLHRVRQGTHGRKKPGPLPRGPVIDLSLPDYTENNPTPCTLQDFESEMLKLVDGVYEADDRILRVVLLIDEVDNVLDQPWTDDLFGYLRAMIYDGDASDYIRIIMTGSGRFLDVDEKGSPLINAIISLFLEPFSFQATEKLISRAEGISTEIAKSVAREAGHHPFVLQHILHYLYKEGIANATEESVRDGVRRFIRDRSADLEGWWGAIGDDGRRIYCILRDSDEWMSNAELVAAVNRPDLQPEKGLKALQYHGLAIHDGSHKNFRYSGALFQAWSERKCAMLGHAQSPDETVRSIDPALTLDQDPERVARQRPIVDVIMAKFDREEFVSLCYMLSINYHSIAPGGLEYQAIQLVQHYDRRDDLGSLRNVISELRKNVIWPE